MKTYPPIPRKVISGTSVYVFDKLDGSNIRAEWSKKNGFYKYGSRRRLLGADEKPLGQAIELFNDKYGNELSKRLADARQDRAVCYFEFGGKNSFAGTHYESDDFDVVLFDIAFYKHGIISPKDFLSLTSGLDTPTLIHHGTIDSEFVDDIKQSKIPEVTYEGVVCKYQKGKVTKMFKIKSNVWLERLKEYCGEDNALFERLK